MLWDEIQLVPTMIISPYAYEFPDCYSSCFPSMNFHFMTVSLTWKCTTLKMLNIPALENKKSRP